MWDLHRAALPHALADGDAAPDRDEARLGDVVLISDRGLRHTSNDDAAAVGMLADGGAARPHAVVAVVCDGVSTSHGAALASTAASKAGVDGMLAAFAEARTAEEAVLAGLADAASAAEASAGVNGHPGAAPSCTYTAAAVVVNEAGATIITVGNVGDSRSYWLPLSADAPRQLTVDDSVAQQLLNAGLPADSPAVARMAHVLSRWLGGSAESKPLSDSNVQRIEAEGAGLLLLCTDGLWNYFPEPADIAAVCTGLDPVGAARALVDRALQEGGHDNVTVAVIPIGVTIERS